MDMESKTYGKGKEKRSADKMKSDNRLKRVEFIDNSIFKAYRKLQEGTSEEKELTHQIDRAIGDLKKNPLAGAKVPRYLWPKEYIRKYGISNLRTYDLPKGWRLIYTLVGDEIEIVSIILEWFDHGGYEKRFGYKKK